MVTAGVGGMALGCGEGSGEAERVGVGSCLEGSPESPMRATATIAPASTTAPARLMIRIFRILTVPSSIYPQTTGGAM